MSTQTTADEIAATDKPSNAVDPDEATDELFTMADTIRSDGLYDVPIQNWWKKETPHGTDSVVVQYETPIDGTHTNTYEWPTKPTEDNQFVQILMAALGLDDPVAATSRADALQGPDGDAIGATVPCNPDSGWNLKPSAATVHDDEATDGRANRTPPGYMLLMVVFAPIEAIWFILHGFFGFEDQRSHNNRYDTAKVAAATMFGMVIWTLVLLPLIFL